MALDYFSNSSILVGETTKITSSFEIRSAQGVVAEQFCIVSRVVCKYPVTNQTGRKPCLCYTEPWYKQLVTDFLSKQAEVAVKRGKNIHQNIQLKLLVNLWDGVQRSPRRVVNNLVPNDISRRRNVKLYIIRRFWSLSRTRPYLWWCSVRNPAFPTSPSGILLVRAASTLWIRCLSHGRHFSNLLYFLLMTCPWLPRLLINRLIIIYLLPISFFLYLLFFLFILSLPPMRTLPAFPVVIICMYPPPSFLLTTRPCSSMICCRTLLYNCLALCSITNMKNFPSIF